MSQILGFGEQNVSQKSLLYVNANLIMFLKTRIMFAVHVAAFCNLEIYQTDLCEIWHGLCTQTCLHNSDIHDRTQNMQMKILRTMKPRSRDFIYAAISLS
jgi:hypothetical protein